MRAYSFPLSRAAAPAAAFGARSQAGAPCVPPRLADPARLAHLTGRTMGTTWSLRADNPRMLALETLRDTLQAALDEVVAQMSHWESASVLSRFNRAQAGSRHALPGPLATVLARALHWAQASDGAFDPTMGALVGLWGFGPEAVPQGSPPPDEDTLARARTSCGWQRLRHDAIRGSAMQPGGLWLDLSGIAKGFGVDAGVDALRQLGLSDFLLEVGGELRGVGRRPIGQSWQVLIDTGTGTTQRIALGDQAIASSGDRWHVREQAGRRWSHTLDPRTGAPVTHRLACVTVLQADCMDADALATVLMVLGAEDGLAFANRHAVPALLAERRPDATVQLHRSDAWPSARTGP